MSMPGKYKGFDADTETYLRQRDKARGLVVMPDTSTELITLDEEHYYQFFDVFNSLTGGANHERIFLSQSSALAEVAKRYIDTQYEQHRILISAEMIARKMRILPATIHKHIQTMRQIGLVTPLYDASPMLVRVKQLHKEVYCG
jgi:hypothetical protein